MNGRSSSEQTKEITTAFATLFAKNHSKDSKNENVGFSPNPHVRTTGGEDSSTRRAFYKHNIKQH